jgi:hypothetical protein
MERSVQTVCLILLALAMIACSAATSATQESTPTPSEGFYPFTTKTGIEEVDTIIETIASGDAQMLRSLIQFTDTKCTKAEGMGGPPKCRAGEAEGMPVEVLPILGPEGHFFYKEEIEEWTGVEADGVYAIYQVSSEVYSEPEFPAGKYAVMFVDKRSPAIISLRLDNGQIVRVDYILDLSPEISKGWIEREAANVILAPLK